MCGAGHNLVKKSAIHPSCAIKMASVFRVVGPRFLFLFLFFFFNFGFWCVQRIGADNACLRVGWSPGLWYVQNVVAIMKRPA